MKKIGSITASILILSAIALAPPTARASSDDETKKPAEWSNLEDAAQRVSKSKVLSPAAKALVAKEAQQVEAGFNELWAPWEGIIEELRESNKPVDEANIAIDEHNAGGPTVPDLSDREAVLQYNRDIVPYNEKGKLLDKARANAVKHCDLEQKGIKARGEEQIKKIDAFLLSPSCTEFMEVAEGLLSGRIQFKKGLAWRQLVAAAENRADEMFDGRRPPPK